MVGPFPTTFYANSVNWSNYNGTLNTMPAVFSSANPTRNIVCVAIDKTRTFIVFRGASSFCYAQIATTTATGVIFGTATVVASVNITNVDVTLLTSSRVIVAYTSSNGTNFSCKLVAVDFSGTSITDVGSFVEVANVSTQKPSVCALDGSSGLVAYMANTPAFPITQFSVASDRTITINNSVSAETPASQSGDQTLTMLTSTKAVLWYRSRATATANRGLAKLITVSGTTPSITNTLDVTGSSLVAGVSPTFSSAKINDHTIFIVWGRGTEIRCAILSESSNVLSVGSSAQIAATAGLYTAACLPDVNHAVIAYGVSSASTSLRTGVVEINGSTVTPLTTYENTSNDADWIAISAVGQPYALLLYMDDDDSDQGKYSRLQP